VRGFLFYMIQWLENHLSPCFFKSTIGIDCPGCGMQRAFIALLKGNLLQSLEYHPALIPFLITLIVFLLQLKFQHPKGAKLIVSFFIFIFIITLVNYTVKQYHFFSGH
jgi:hypothetical protein